jgi:Undecaprenyl-phosphate glucose phosphotransferase
MSSFQDYTTDFLIAQRRRSGIVRRLFGPLALAADAATIVGLAIATGISWHQFLYAGSGEFSNYVAYGGLVALIFCGMNAARGEYALAKYMTLKRHATRIFYLWNMTFLLVVAIGFVTKSGEIYSRGAVILFYLLGLGSLGIARLVLVRLVVNGTKTGRIAARRVLLVGAEADVVAFAKRYQPWNAGLQIVGMSVLDPDDESGNDLSRAVATARALQPDDVIIALPWSAHDRIEGAVDAFMNIPVSIHLAPERILDRFDSVTISKIGSMATLNLSRPPLSAAEVLGKRAFDVVGALVGLIVLTPLFIAVAVLIKLDSQGPVFFLQKRYGFNQRPFYILKFRTMTTLDDGAVVRQATKNDARVTRVGAILRRWNIDELPQLVNVLFGHMSIVGPRPHAIAHNRDFEQRIALYARRHNVKPGITGWAQVNGYRGETDTDDKMRNRVECDLWYIDNWSFFLDLRILVLTFVSRRAFLNAY